MMDAKSLVKVILWNFLMVAVVFLPVFLTSAHIELRFSGAPSLKGSFWYHAGGAAVVYLGMVLPLELGAFIHSVALALLPSRWATEKRRLVAVAFSPLVPGTVMILGLSGGIMLSSLVGATAIATLAYGFCSQVGPSSLIFFGGHKKGAD